MALTFNIDRVNKVKTHVRPITLPCDQMVVLKKTYLYPLATANDSGVGVGQIVWVAQGGFSVQHSCGTTKAHSPLGRASVCDLRQVPETSQDLVPTCPFLLGIRALAGIKKEMTLFYQEIVTVES